MTDLVKKLIAAGDWFTAGFMAHDDGMFGAVKLYLKRAPLPKYDGSMLYPLRSVWSERGILNYHYSSSAELDGAALEKSDLTAAERNAITQKFGRYHPVGSCISDCYALSGRGYTHYCPEAVDFFDKSLSEYMAVFDGDGELRGKMRALGGAVASYIDRIIIYLSSFDCDNAKRLVKAYNSFLTGRASSFFDAFVRLTFVFMLDGADSLGNIDSDLSSFEMTGGEEKLFAELYDAFEKNNAWNLALGTAPAVAAVALRGFSGASRPNFSVKVDGKTPDAFWDECFDAMARGARPAFYNRAAYEDVMTGLGVEKADAARISFGGCSETMVSGLSNVGSIDGGIDFLHIFRDVFIAHEYDTFDGLLGAYLAEIKRNIAVLVSQVNAEMTAMRGTPQYIRTLLCPPCGKSGREYNDGGAKYYFSVIQLCALANAADSLVAVKKLVYEQKTFSYAEVVRIIETDYSGAGDYLAELSKIEFFGNDAETDVIAAQVFSTAADELARYKTAIGEGAFLPACIMFNTALSVGKMTKATPDGRRAYAPVASSGGAATGRDDTSPTALLNSVVKIEPRRAIGTWIVNITLSSDFVRGDNARRALKSLILGYMENGGLQLQINMTDKALLCAAVDDDELAKTIIVRVGGFSERFSNLSRDFRSLIANRTQY